MGKVQKYFYAVQNGRNRGIFNTWYLYLIIIRDECNAQVVGFSNAKFKKFTSLSEAKQYAEAQINYTKTTRVVEPREQKNVENPSRQTTNTPSSSTKYKTKVVDLETQNDQKCNSPVFDVFVDGSCSHNGMKDSVGGIGVFWGDNDPRNISEQIIYSSQNITNQKAELIVCFKLNLGCTAIIGNSSKIAAS